MIANTDGVSPRIARLLTRIVRDDRERDFDFSPPFADSLDHALDCSQSWLLDQQKEDGHWVGELEGDTILESEYILLKAFLGREGEKDCVKAARYLIGKELPSGAGGWSIYPGGPMDLSASVRAYFALKIVGVPIDEPVLARARDAIRDAGGAQACNSFTRFSLALLGQMSYDECPSVPPELALLPRKMGLGAMSSWTRTIVVPLSIISALKPVRLLRPERGIAELFRDDLPRVPERKTARLFSWTNLFLGLDRVLKTADRLLPRLFRQPGITAAHRWMLEHFEDSDGLGAIFPPMIYTIVALKCLGYADDSPTARWAFGHLEDLKIEEEDTVRLQPCVSPVWDTAIATIALADSPLADFHPALLRSVRWLLDREVRHEGDWSDRRPGVEPGGWFFEYRNRYYPDVDDTAMVLLALQRTALSNEPDVLAATARGVNWIESMQNRDGGWAAFDADIDSEILTHVPFADHNAILDPSCADITARVIEVLGDMGRRRDDPAIARALEYLWRTQEPEGCWYGRWGVNYIYGTWQVLLGLRAIEFPWTDPRVTKAADWLESVQQIDGGWGESCESYDDPWKKGQGAPTASQTAWAVNGLIAAGRADGESVRRGVAYLLDTQLADGSWDEESFTGTGFPRVFYLRYHLYRVYFPLMALARYRKAATQAEKIKPTPSFACRVPALPKMADV